MDSGEKRYNDLCTISNLIMYQEFSFPYKFHHYQLETNNSLFSISINFYLAVFSEFVTLAGNFISELVFLAGRSIPGMAPSDNLGKDKGFCMPSVKLTRLRTRLLNSAFWGPRRDWMLDLELAA